LTRKLGHNIEIPGS
jgi:hypothetical protein